MVFCKLCQDRFNSIHSPSQANCIFQLEVQLDIGKLEERWRDVFIIRSELILPKEESPWESMDWEVDCEISGFDGHDIDWSIRWLVSWKTILVMSHVVHLLNVLMVLCSYVVMGGLWDGNATLSAYGIPVSRSTVVQLKWDADDEEYGNNAEWVMIQLDHFWLWWPWHRLEYQMVGVLKNNSRHVSCCPSLKCSYGLMFLCCYAT